GDSVMAFLREQVRPLVETILVDHINVVSDQVLDLLSHGLIHWCVLGANVHPQAPIIARYFFQNPRTEASVARNGCEHASEPPIPNKPAPSLSLPCTARGTTPPTAPSSIEI